MTPWENLREEAKKFNVMLSDEKLEKFRILYRILIEKNKVMNLTRITEEEDVILKHFLDSLSLFLAVDPPGNVRLIDIGAGAGFPSLPLLIARPNWKGCLVESTKKKANFIEEAVEALGLKAQVCPDRAEDLGRSPAFREKHDLAVARGVSDLAVLAEICLPLVRVGGLFVAYKGGDFKAELEGARGAINKMGGTIENTVSLDLPGGTGSRSLIIIEKESSTPPAYPRSAGIPQRQKLR